MSIPFPENRLSRKGLQQAGSKISFQFNGNMLEGLAGETIAAALTSMGSTGFEMTVPVAGAVSIAAWVLAMIAW